MATIPYKNKAGQRLQGATTVVGQNVGWGKDPLLYWANKQGLDGKTLAESRDTATIPGTIAHALIEANLKGLEPDTNQYTQEDISKAETSYLNYLDWRKQFNFEPIYVEKNMVSEDYQYGGCPDVVGKIGNKWILVDWKSGRTFSSLFLQLAAYEQLCFEVLDISIDEFHLLRIPRNEEIPSFHHSHWGKLPMIAWESFKAALLLSKAEKELKKLL